jgi:hypothetical protein
LEEIFNVFWFWKPFHKFFSKVTSRTLKFNNGKILSMLKRFFQNQKILNISFKIFFKEAEILYGSSWINCGWNFDEINKKSIKEKKPARGFEPATIWANGWIQIS